MLLKKDIKFCRTYSAASGNHTGTKPCNLHSINLGRGLGSANEACLIAASHFTGETVSSNSGGLSVTSKIRTDLGCNG